MRINTETVAFIGFLNKLAAISEDSIRPFSAVTPEDREGLLYDDESPICKADTDFDDDVSYPLVADCIIDAEHHDMISTWTEIYAPKGIRIVVNAGSDGDPYVCITSEYDNEFFIAVEDGYWYNVE